MIQENVAKWWENKKIYKKHHTSRLAHIFINRGPYKPKNELHSKNIYNFLNKSLKICWRRGVVSQITQIKDSIISKLETKKKQRKHNSKK